MGKYRGTPHQWRAVESPYSDTAPDPGRGESVGVYDMIEDLERFILLSQSSTPPTWDSDNLDSLSRPAHSLGEQERQAWNTRLNHRSPTPAVHEAPRWHSSASVGARRKPASACHSWSWSGQELDRMINEGGLPRDDSFSQCDLRSAPGNKFRTNSLQRRKSLLRIAWPWARWNPAAISSQSSSESFADWRRNSPSWGPT